MRSLPPPRTRAALTSVGKTIGANPQYRKHNVPCPVSALATFHNDLSYSRCSSKSDPFGNRTTCRAMVYHTTESRAPRSLARIRSGSPNGGQPKRHRVCRCHGGNTPSSQHTSHARCLSRRTCARWGDTGQDRRSWSFSRRLGGSSFGCSWRATGFPSRL